MRNAGSFANHLMPRRLEALLVVFPALEGAPLREIKGRAKGQGFKN